MDGGLSSTRKSRCTSEWQGKHPSQQHCGSFPPACLFQLRRRPCPRSVENGFRKYSCPLISGFQNYLEKQWCSFVRVGAGRVAKRPPCVVKEKTRCFSIIIINDNNIIKIRGDKMGGGWHQVF